MANLLAHCLSAMAVQSALNPVLGLGYISESSFLAGIVGMIIDLDSDCYNGRRTPYLHSSLFAVTYSLVFAYAAMLMLRYGLVQWNPAITLMVVLPAGFAPHIAVDALTDEGVFLLPKSYRLSNLFQRKPDSKNSWVYWKTYSLNRNRRNDDPILNLCVSSVSLVVLILLLSLTPL